jgi:type II secretory pathway pseudopilin PulG
MRKRRESGFAMLLVFAMAAAVALMLYRELPRLVFQAQRVKEQDLMARGLEYRRAIQLYVRKNKRYPQSLDDLERGAQIRYLRRRYKDPMTGKGEWRLVHIDNAGFFTDSLIHKPKEQEEKKSQNTFITEGAAFGSTGPAPGQEAGHAGAGIRGASDRPVVTAQQFQGPPGGEPLQPGAPPPPDFGGQAPGTAPLYPFNPQQGQDPGTQPQSSDPQQPGAYPYQQPQPFGVQPDQQQNPYPYQQQMPPFGAQPGQDPNQPQPTPHVQIGVAPYVVPAQPNPVQLQPGQQTPYPVAPGQYQPVPVPGAPQMAYPFPQQAVPGQPNPAVPFGVTPYIVPGQPQPYNPQQPQPYNPQQLQQLQPGQPAVAYPSQGIPGLPGPYGVQPQAASPPVRGQLQPAPGQANPAAQLIQQILTTPRPGGLQGTAAATAGAAMIPGGIAGVATTFEAEGIMVFNERTKYNEWEFLYDYRQEQAAAGASAALGAGAGGDRNPLGTQQQGQQGNRPFSFGGPQQQPSPFGGAPQQGPPSRFGPTR